MRGFLRQIVTDTAVDGAVRISSRELLGIGTGLGVRGTIGIAFERNRRDGDLRRTGKPLFQLIVFRFAFGQSEAPAVIVDHDGNVIWVVEGHGAAIERGIVEVPFRRCELPYELGELSAIFVIAGSPALGGKIELVPQLDRKTTRLKSSQLGISYA